MSVNNGFLFNLKKRLFHLYISLRKFLGLSGSEVDFMIIGAQKGGTSSLFYYLEQHPQIVGAKKKETHFFDRYYYKGINWYEAFYGKRSKDENLLLGEATPCYMFHPKSAIRVKKYYPNAKFIVMLRDPIDRAFSDYFMEFNRGNDSSSTFEEALGKERIRKDAFDEKLFDNPEYFDTNRHYFSYVGRGEYYSQIENWLKEFDRKQFLFIISENFFLDPKETLKQVYDFLGINTIFPNNLKPQNIGVYKKKISEETVAQLKVEFEKEYEELHRLINLETNWRK